MQLPKNPLELFNLYMQFTNSPNPMASFKNAFGGNPIFDRLSQMVEGKSEQQVKQIVLNLCKERGLNPDVALNVLRSVGFKL